MQTLKNRILTGWTFARALYFILGMAVIIQAIVEKQYIGLIFGAYFASMGLFGFGCAGGSCNATYSKASESNNNPIIEDVTYEEIKSPIK